MHILDASDFAHGMQKLLDERKELYGRTKAHAEFLRKLCEALGFAPSAVPRRYIVGTSLEEAILKVLEDAKVNAYRLAAEVTGDEDQ